MRFPSIAGAALLASSVLAATIASPRAVEGVPETSSHLASGDIVLSEEDATLLAHDTNFELPVDDKLFILNFALNTPGDEGATCGDGRQLFIDNIGISAASPVIRLDLEDSLNRKRHSVGLYFEFSCQGSQRTAWASVVQVDGVDRSLGAESTADFSVRWDPQSQLIKGFQTGTDIAFLEDIEQVLSSPKSFVALLGPTDGPIYWPYNQTQYGILHTENGYPVSPSAEAAVYILEDIEQEQLAVEERYRAQKEIVDQLTNGKYTPKCRNCEWARIFKQYLAKSKAFIHRVYLRVVTYVAPSRTRKQSCSSLMSALSPAARVKVLMSPPKDCSDEKHRPDGSEHKLLSNIQEDEIWSHDDEDKVAYDELDIPYHDEKTTPHNNVTSGPTSAASFHLNSTNPADHTTSRQPFTTRHRVHAAMGVAFSLLCLGCVFTVLRQRCCSPRARADRAAWREERRNEREYRQAARKQAWKDWWSSKRGCLCCGARRDRRIADYEEKRALIVGQEDVLDRAMHDQIRVLQRDHIEQHGGNVSSAAEEGRVPVPRSARMSTHRPSDDRRHRGSRQSRTGTVGSDISAPDSLPSYRSRDSSRAWGRPPSYRSRATSSPVRQDYDIGPLVADGFEGYMPEAETSSDESDGSEAHLTDRTPDSSVVGISPRMSSETLRSERSAL